MPIGESDLWVSRKSTECAACLLCAAIPLDARYVRHMRANVSVRPISQPAGGTLAYPQTWLRIVQSGPQDRAQ